MDATELKLIRFKNSKVVPLFLKLENRSMGNLRNYTNVGNQAAIRIENILDDQMAKIIFPTDSMPGSKYERY